MADPDGYNRFTLKFQSPWRGGTTKDWSLKFSMSGVTITEFAAAEATAQGLWLPIQKIITGATNFTGWLYYPAGTNVNTLSNEYPHGSNVGTGAGYNDFASAEEQQLEVCAIIRAPVGRSSKGRQTYLFKHIHDVLRDQGGPNTLAALTSATLFETWSTGVGPNDLVTVSPSTGDASGAWTVDPGLYTRQLRRGQPAKA